MVQIAGRSVRGERVVVGVALLGAVLLVLICVATGGFISVQRADWLLLLSFLFVAGTAWEWRNPPRKVVGALALVAAVLALCAALATFVLAGWDTARGLGYAGKGVTALVLLGATSAMAARNLAPRAEASAEASGEAGSAAAIKDVEDAAAASPAEAGGAGKVASCCKSFCWSFLLVLSMLASLTMVLNTADMYAYDPNESAYVEVEGHKIFTRCSGAGEPTIFLEHGLGGNSLDWSWVQANLSVSNRVCSYDRAGYGRSLESGAMPRVSDQLSNETYGVIRALNIDKALFVGHSFAGFNLRALEKKHPELFLGIVWVDAVNPNTTRDCDPSVAYPSGIYGIGPMVAQTGVLRILNLIGFINGFEPSLVKLPADKQAEYRAGLMKDTYFSTRVSEYVYWGRNCALIGGEQGEDKALNFPVTHVYPVNGIYKAWNDYSAGGRNYAEELTALSTVFGKAVRIEDKEAGHTGVVFDLKYAQTTIDEVRSMLALLAVNRTA
jgi:pimeloyl-ACP methyl ester carboxylesterase